MQPVNIVEKFKEWKPLVVSALQPEGNGIEVSKYNTQQYQAH